MIPEDKSFIEQWDKVRKGGFWLYCLKVGGIWSVIVFILTLVFTFFDPNAPTIELNFKLLLSFLNYFLAGFFGVGALTWLYANHRYNKIKKRYDQS